MHFEFGNLQNTYFGLRHGRSKPNEEGIIISDPERGIHEFGLVPEGVAEVEASITSAKAEGLLDDSTLLTSSDFLRSGQTTKIAARILGIKRFLFSNSLRERNFGRLEGGSNKRYAEVWERDARNPDHRYMGVESANEVLVRQFPLIGFFEKLFTGRKIVFSGHGDTLQIVDTAFKGIPVSSHRSLPHFNTGEIRQLNNLTHVP